MACLQRDLHALDAHAERLETIDAGAVARSPSAVAELPDPERCLDADDGLDERHIRHLAAVEHLLLLGFAHLGESVVALDVVRVARDAARVGLLRAVEVALLEEGDAEARVALAPLGFDLDALLRILNRGVLLAHRRVARGAVRVEDCGGWRRGGVGFVSAPARCDRRGARIWVETRGGPPLLASVQMMELEN